MSTIGHRGGKLEHPIWRCVLALRPRSPRELNSDAFDLDAHVLFDLRQYVLGEILQQPIAQCRRHVANLGGVAKFDVQMVTGVSVIAAAAGGGRQLSRQTCAAQSF